MDGRLRLWLTGGLVAAILPAVGCKLFQQDQPAAAGGAAVVPVAGQKGSGNSIFQAGFFKPQPSQYRPTETPTTPQPGRKKGQPFKPETDIAIADVEIEAAFDENRTGADRDRIIDAARMRLQETLKKDPKNKGAMLELGKVYTWAGDRERAFAEYQKAAKLYPKDADVPFAMMKSCNRFGDWAGACKACEAALALDPENRTYRKAYGSVLAMAERWDEAYDALIKVMNKSETHTHLGRLLIDNFGNIPEGQKQLQIALREDPQNETAQRVLAELAEYQQTGGQK